MQSETISSESPSALGNSSFLRTFRATKVNQHLGPCDSRDICRFYSAVLLKCASLVKAHITPAPANPGGFGVPGLIWPTNRDEAENAPLWGSCPCRLPCGKAYGSHTWSRVLYLSIPGSDCRSGHPCSWRKSPWG